MSSEAIPDVQMPHQQLRSFEEAKSLPKAGDGLQGGEGDTGDSSLCLCPSNQAKGTLPFFKGASGTLAQSYFL